MIPPFDVFSTTNNGPVWIGAAESLVQALQIARKKGTGSHFVFSLSAGPSSSCCDSRAREKPYLVSCVACVNCFSGYLGGISFRHSFTIFPHSGLDRLYSPQ
jgi:hypothetical protein